MVTLTFRPPSFRCTEESTPVSLPPSFHYAKELPSRSSLLSKESCKCHLSSVLANSQIYVWVSPPSEEFTPWVVILRLFIVLDFASDADCHQHPLFFIPSIFLRITDGFLYALIHKRVFFQIIFSKCPFYEKSSRRQNRLQFPRFLWLRVNKFSSLSSWWERERDYISRLAVGFLSGVRNIHIHIRGNNMQILNYIYIYI